MQGGWDKGGEGVTRQDPLSATMWLHQFLTTVQLCRQS